MCNYGVAKKMSLTMMRSSRGEFDATVTLLGNTNTYIYTYTCIYIGSIHIRASIIEYILNTSIAKFIVFLYCYQKTLANLDLI